MTREPDDREIDREEDEEFKPLTPEAAQQLAGRMPKPVSYTHLTLPTIYSV